MKHQAGFGLLQTIIVAFALAAGSIALVNLRVFYLDSMQAKAGLNARNTVAALVSSSAISLTPLLRKNRDENLQSCLLQTSCAAVSDRPVTLRDGLNRRISGPINAGARFAYGGFPCDGSSLSNETCPILVETTYSTSCRGGVAMCTYPEKVTISYRVKGDSKASLQWIRDMIPLTGTVIVGNLMCPTGQVMSGIDSDGTAVCITPVAWVGIPGHKGPPGTPGPVAAVGTPCP